MSAPRDPSTCSIPLSLFPQASVPYIIVAPRYNGASAGIRALHLLCHSLNLTGQRAFLHIYPQVIWDNRHVYTCPELCTPLLTRDDLDYFEEQKRYPIVVYPETIPGNPLNSANVVRWILNYPGLLGGDKEFAAYELLFSYSKRLAEHCHIGEERVMFLPVSDPTIFYPPPQGNVRKGSCFYASKYQNHHHGKLMPITEGSVEITRDLPDSLTKPQIADLLRRSEIFYTYEDTALAIEAGMCGCPTVFIPNEYLSRPLGFDDLGMDGFAWGTTPEDIAQAKETVARFPGNYQALIARYWKQLERFAEVTQVAAKARNAQADPLSRINICSPLKRHMNMTTLKRYGWRKFLAKFMHEIRFRGFWNMARFTLRNIFAR